MRQIVYVVALLLWVSTAAADPFREFLNAHGKPPAEYLLAKLDDHRIVIAGEEHWRRDDAVLIAGIVPELRRRGVALAIETLRAERQSDIDRLITAPEWDQKLANEILRAADWPYVQYRDILHAAWKTNRTDDGPPLKIIALGPPRDFREKKIRYDESMAQRVIDHLAEDKDRRILVFCGMHHAFTRYLQVERRQRGRATEFMDRMGNILWRRFGQNVFLVALHKTEMCGPGNEPEKQQCLPFGGRIDCAATRPVGFDVAASPIAELKFPQSSFYAFGHPLLRLIDYADGYIWTRTIDETRMVDVIPLEEYSPELATDAKSIEDWKKHTEYLEHPLARASWASIATWRSRCE